MDLITLFQEIVLWLILSLYLHMVRFIDLIQHTAVRTIKDYFKYANSVVYVIIMTQILIFLGYCILKYF